ncbi:MAG TPA: hypothetical protein VJR06_01215 [Nitrososphaerales archaeon]|nr:hypothetical protein [Nitrososphaerales archaeon]
MVSTGTVALRTTVSGATLLTVTSGASNMVSILVYPVSGAVGTPAQVQVFDAISGIANVNSGALIYATVSGQSTGLQAIGVEIPCKSGIVVQGAASSVTEILYAQ